jgi:hypothetical protein
VSFRVLLVPRMRDTSVTRSTGTIADFGCPDLQIHGPGVTAWSPLACWQSRLRTSV